MSEQPSPEAEPQPEPAADPDAGWRERHPNPSGLDPGAGPAETPRPVAAWTEEGHYEPWTGFTHTEGGEEVPPLP